MIKCIFLALTLFISTPGHSDTYLGTWECIPMLSLEQTSSQMKRDGYLTLYFKQIGIVQLRLISTKQQDVQYQLTVPSFSAFHDVKMWLKENLIRKAYLRFLQLTLKQPHRAMKVNSIATPLLNAVTRLNKKVNISRGEPGQNQR